MKTIEIYTLDYCPYCQKAKFFFNERSIPFTEIPSDDTEEETREMLTKKYNLKSLATFPQIIVNGVNIGGYSDLISKYENKEINFD